MIDYLKDSHKFTSSRTVRVALDSAAKRLTQLSEAHRRIADNPVTFSQAAAEVSRAALAQGQKEGA
ncbi:hypothetical protein [Paracoccus yeei]|uniref:hypothetical protein n=1 Tax=Paracoccus yeei TaxID=147645 RepID=UPI003BF8ACC3